MSSQEMDESQGDVLHMLQSEVERRQRAEEELQKARQELDRLADAGKNLQRQRLDSLGILAGGIAHDFNNILFSIQGNAELARYKLPTASTVDNNLRAILEATQRASKLCQQMLAFSGRGPVAAEPTDLNRLTRDMSQLFETLSKKVRVHDELGRQPPVVLADRSQIRQVLLNLVTNAAEAIGEKGGNVVLRSGRRMIEDREYGMLEIRDDGCGMDSETVERVFDPFYSTKFVGRGLGLAAAIGIVGQHEGTIEIESEPGEGTIVRLLLPTCQDPMEQSGEMPTLSSTWRGGGTILLVDDEDPVRMVGAQMLEEAGFHALDAVDGIEALELYRKHEGEIVCTLLDLSMPRMDGEETFLEIRRLYPEAKVILSSGYSEKEAVSRFKDRGLAGFLEKPYSYEELLGKLREVLG